MNQIIIDVREPFEFSMGHVDGALNIPPSVIMDVLPGELENVAKDTLLVLYCRSGARSGASMQFLKRYGFTNMVNGINKDHVQNKYI